jgi:hypothetical protein
MIEFGEEVITPPSVIVLEQSALTEFISKEEGDYGILI